MKVSYPLTKGKERIVEIMLLVEWRDMVIIKNNKKERNLAISGDIWLTKRGE